LEDAAEIAARLVAGDRAALSRLISWAENGDPRFPSVLATLYPRVGRARRLGVTGPPGAGKSTFVNALAGKLRVRGETVGILAVDPSSPFSGGALLGDRIRMEERTADPGVYIRSMATRRTRGGLARAAVDACDVMDAFGFDVLLVETVGVGQSEYEVVEAADTVLVVLCPGAGDGVQAMKAGILEVADVLVVNKSDLPGADRLALDLEDALDLRALRRDGREPPWRVPVVATSALEERGLERVLEVLDDHRRWLEQGDLAELRRKKRAAHVRRVVGERLERELWGGQGADARVDSLLRGSSTAYDAAEEILGSFLEGLKERASRRP
jgi:LAO/AO transport system kinase